MTVQKCIDRCAAAVFSSAGLEFGKECFCGNISFPPGSSAELDECNMPCLGDASQYVLWLSNMLYENMIIYILVGTAVAETEFSFTLSLERTLLQPIQLVHGLPLREAAGVTMSIVFEHLNMVPMAMTTWLLQSVKPSARPKDSILPVLNMGVNAVRISSIHITRSLIGNDVVCGNTIMGNNRPTTGICTMPCTGDSTQICGGPDAISIYVKDNYPYTTGPATVLDSYNGYDKTECWQYAYFAGFLDGIHLPLL
jgi:hypothetical protein